MDVREMRDVSRLRDMTHACILRDGLVGDWSRL